MTTMNPAEIAAVETAAEQKATYPTMTATYSPEDNKLRLYSSARLDTATYNRVKEAGFKWAPKQELFVAPMWTPARENLLLELCGEIGDEDTSLVDRAEERADRFADYQERRAGEASAALNAVKSITEHIPFGQPILVGHHSERRARKDAERIENGMRRAVNLWDTSEYWKRRAAGAIRAAKYKERADVRHRRIKGLEADKRKQEKTVADAEQLSTAWQAEGLTLALAKRLAGFSHISRCFPLSEFPRNPPASQYEGPKSLWSALEDGIINEIQARDMALASFARSIAWAKRWIAHYENRLAYERAMLDEQGGIAADQFNIEKGGRVLIGGEWLVVLRVNKANGRINSVTTNAKMVAVRGIEEVKDYKAPEAADVEKVKAAAKLPPLCNYPGEGFTEMTAAEWKRKQSYTDSAFVDTIKATETTGTHRARTVCGQNWKRVQVFITDAKRVDPPAAPAAPAAPVKFERELEPTEPRQVSAPKEPTQFDLLRDQLREGVQVVSAPQLFPTPADLAARMVEEAAIEAGNSVLEPSAGTARILQAIAESMPLDQIDVTAIEVNDTIARTLAARYPTVRTICRDFMQHPAALNQYDRILMNPPFANGQDIAHIQHALAMLKIGGTLVAICANGPRQREKLLPIVEAHGGTWEELPADTFKESGTGVNTVLLTVTL